MPFGAVAAPYAEVSRGPFPSWRICLTTDVMHADGNVRFVGFDIGANRIANTYWHDRLKFQHLEEWRAQRRLLPSPRPARHVPRRPATPFVPPLPPIYERFDRIPGRTIRLHELKVQALRRGERVSIARHDILWRRLTKPAECSERSLARKFLWRHWRLQRDIDVLLRRIERTLSSAGWSARHHPRPGREFVAVEGPFGERCEARVRFRSIHELSP